MGLSGVSLLLILLSQQPDRTALSGRWTLKFNAVFPIPDTTCEFKTEGSKLSGECRDKEGHPANESRTSLTGTLSVDRGAEVGSFAGSKM